MNQQTKVTILAVLAAILVLAAMFSGLQPSVTVGAENAHSTTKEVRDGQLATGESLLTFNTGECGYYRETGMLHRNMETPFYCFHDNGSTFVNQSEKPAQTRTEANRDIVESTDKPAVYIPPMEVNPTDKQDKQSKKHCNNGEGNGAEGCSPAKSANANNDENQTTPSQDNSHGNSDHAHGHGK